jgi:hypothetical protein
MALGCRVTTGTLPCRHSIRMGLERKSRGRRLQSAGTLPGSRKPEDQLVSIIRVPLKSAIEARLIYMHALRPLASASMVLIGESYLIRKILLIDSVVYAPLTGWRGLQDDSGRPVFFLAISLPDAAESAPRSPI